MSFYNDIRTEIRNGIETINALNKKKEAVDQEIRSGNYAGERLHELTVASSKYKRNLQEERKSQLDKIHTLCTQYAEALRQEDDYDPAAITDDLKLLTSGITLNKRDLQAILDRNSQNRTMTRLTLQYCQDQDIDIGLTYNGNDDLIRNVGIIPELAGTVFRYADDMDGTAGRFYDRLLGDGSEMAEIFADD